MGFRFKKINSFFFAGTYGEGVFRLTNNGTRWKSLASPVSSVSALFAGDVDAGYHEIQSNPIGLASGMCLCRLPTGAFSPVHTMALVR